MLYVSPHAVTCTAPLSLPPSSPLPPPSLPPILSPSSPSSPPLLPPPSLLPPPVCRNNSCLAERYHPGTVNGNKYTCCSANKQEPGCEDTFFKLNQGRPYPAAAPGQPISVLPYGQSQMQPSAGSIQYQSASTYGQQLRQHKLYGGAVGQGRGQHDSMGGTHNGERRGWVGEGGGEGGGEGVAATSALAQLYH